ncbi:MAG TPA: tetratricopeptide repeat protein [Anaerolineales bacterium]|nr:tetratricopeptide repeat protein [Anaerolineales bacterium]
MAQGEFALLRDSLQPALDLSGQPVQRGTMAHEHAVCMMLVEAATMGAEEAGLRQYAPRLEQLAMHDDHRLYLAIAHRGWGAAHRLAGEYAEAEVRLNQALELFQGMQARWQVGRTLCELAALDRARSDNEAALEHLGQALEAFEALGAAPDVERTRQALASMS